MSTPATLALLWIGLGLLAFLDARRGSQTMN